jgi:hypothetical protein
VILLNTKSFLLIQIAQHAAEAPVIINFFVFKGTPVLTRHQKSSQCPPRSVVQSQHRPSFAATPEENPILGSVASHLPVAASDSGVGFHRPATTASRHRHSKQHARACFRRAGNRLQKQADKIRKFSCLSNNFNYAYMYRVLNLIHMYLK